MKRFILFILFLSLIFPLACGSALADDPSAEPTVTPDVTETPIVSPSPEPSPVPSAVVPVTSETDLMQQQLVVLGNIQGYLIFGLVVLLCFFAYKFFRMFF